MIERTGSGPLTCRGLIVNGELPVSTSAAASDARALENEVQAPQLERFATPRNRSRCAFGASAAAFLASCVALVAATPATAGTTLDRLKSTGHLKLGYIGDARPFSANGSDGPEGYAIALCQHIAASLEKQLASQRLTVDWQLVSFDRSLPQVTSGDLDLLCAPTVATLDKQDAVAFSIPIFAGGNRAVIRADAPTQLRNVLEEHQPSTPVWRGSPATTLLEGMSFAVTKGTTTEQWLRSRRDLFKVDFRIVTAPDYRAGLQLVRDRKVAAFFGERSIILGVLGAQAGAAREDVVILDRLFTHEPLGLATPRGDDEFRLMVDRALSQLYASDEFPKLYSKWCGDWDASTRTFFQSVTLPQ